MAFRFLHTSDVHLLDLRGVRPWHYLNKRITGRLNLALHRAKRHDQGLFDIMMRRASELGVDRVVVTGDLTNLSLESEFVLCRDKLAALPIPVTVIPGNHDAYTTRTVRGRRFERYFSSFMEGDSIDGAEYPFMVRAQGVALIGVSTAVPTPPFIATGRIGPEQLQRLERMLGRAAAEGRARVVLLHHPPTEGVSKPRHDLRDAEAFRAVIARAGAELVLHGHEHRRIDTELTGPSGMIPVHGAPSGTSRSEKAHRRAGFSVYEVGPATLRRGWYEWDGRAFAESQA